MVDSKKYEILEILGNDSTVSAKEISLMIDESEEDVKTAIEELEEQKAIVKYVAVVNNESLEHNTKVEAMIEVKVTPQRELGYDDLAKRIYMFPEVKSVYLMAGNYDLAVTVESDDMKSISQFVFEKLAVINGVTSTATVFIMRKYKENGVVLVGEEDDTRLVVSP